MAIRKMFPKMLDITSQMILKWDNFGPDHAFDVSDNFTRLSLDVIALCAFDYRFNNFYTDKVHPFVDALMSVLWEASRRATRSAFENWIRIWSWREFQAQTAKMHSICDAIVAERKKNPKDVDDLLNVMLLSSDKETGDRLSDENIRFQVETFLVSAASPISISIDLERLRVMRRHPDYSPSPAGYSSKIPTSVPKRQRKWIQFWATPT